jgi:hypothetical protein
VLYALSVAPPGQRADLAALLDRACSCHEARAQVWAEIIRLGGLYYLLMEAEVLRRRAQVALESLHAGSARDCLLSLLDTTFVLPQWNQNVDDRAALTGYPIPVGAASLCD